MGLKGSGKTCYLTAMTQAMSSGLWLEGKVFQIIAPNLGQIQPLQNAYNGMINDGVWPPSTDSISQYDFDSTLNLKPVMSFSLIDYPGGQMTAEELSEKFSECDAVIILIDAERLKNGLAANDAQKINTIYNKLVRDREVIPPTIVVVSKSDLLANEHEANKIDNNLFTTFKVLFGQGSNIISGITHVKLGEKLSNQGSKIFGTLDLRPEAGNLAIPILFTYYAQLFFDRQQADDEVDQNRTDVSKRNSNLRAIQNKNFLGRMLNKLNGKESDAENALSIAVRKLNLSEKQQKKLCETINSIEPVLFENSKIYYDGNLLNPKK